MLILQYFQKVSSMKKVCLSLFCLLLLCGCTVARSDQTETTTEPVTVSGGELTVRSVWITYYELQAFTGKYDTGDGFYSAVSKAFAGLQKRGFTAVTVQVHPCADAFYRSEYFPVSAYCFGKEGGALKYDPLELLCKAAHENQLKIEAWFNPYRVSQQNKIEKLSNGNIAKKWYKEKNGNVVIVNKKIYFNPAAKAVQKYIVAGVREIVKNYPVDGIHFDDYFYPDTDKKIDAKQYAAYRADGGTRSLGTWRRSQVNDLIRAVYNAVKEEDKNCIFGISPAAGIANDRDSLYADVETWATQKGYCDYLCPQVYFGFLNDTLPFMKTVKDWQDMVTACDLYIGLPLYKCGKADAYAGRGKAEFQENKNMIFRQIQFIRQIPAVKGFYVFSYSYLSDDSVKVEVSGLYSAMQ